MTQGKPSDGREERGRNAQLDAMLEQLNIERAPTSLTRKLKRIPRDERRRERSGSWEPPRWVLAPALAAVPILVIALVLTQPDRPSASEIEQVRQDLALAFSYIDKVGHRTGSEIQDVLGGELRHQVKGNLSRHILNSEQFRKEETS